MIKTNTTYVCDNCAFESNTGFSTTSLYFGRVATSLYDYAYAKVGDFCTYTCLAEYLEKTQERRDEARRIEEEKITEGFLPSNTRRGWIEKKFKAL